MTFSPRRYSRVSCLHSMRGICAPFQFRRGHIGFAHDTYALPVAQALVVSNQLISRSESGNDRGPAILLRLSELNRAMVGDAALRIDDPGHRHVTCALEQI